MDINVNVKIEVVGNENGDDTVHYVQRIADELKNWVQSTIEMNAPMAPAEPEQEPEQEEKPEPEQQVTLEDVRAKLGQLTKDGKQAQVKELIKKFGGAKLSDVPEDKYPELLKAAGGL